MAALLSIGPFKVTKFEGDHIPLNYLVNMGFPQYIFHPQCLRTSSSRTEISGN